MRYSNSTTMEHAGFKANVMEAERLTGDRTHALPPGSALPVHRVSEFKKHPDNWMEEDGCYVVPVRPNKGLWFDWTMNDAMNSAVVPTVKGCNPITGMKTDRLGLERYENKCPKHNIEFKAERYCEECGYKWPAQNYITTPNYLWWDGFRANDGTVRQFFITEDMMRDIATHMIGKENTVPAFGFAFFKPKIIRMNQYISFHTIDGNGIFNSGAPWDNPSWTYTGGGTAKGIPKGAQVFYSSNCIPDGGKCVGESDASLIYNSVDDSVGSILCSADVSGTSAKVKNFTHTSAAPDPDILLQNKAKFITTRGIVKKSVAPTPVLKKEVAIGAGAKIDQSLIIDPYTLDSWKEEPDSIMRIYFVFQNEFDHWKSFGMKDLDGKVHGMLDNLPVG